MAWQRLRARSAGARATTRPAGQRPASGREVASSRGPCDAIDVPTLVVGHVQRPVRASDDTRWSACQSPVRASRKPPTRTSAGPLGPSSQGIHRTSYPTFVERFHEPWKAMTAWSLQKASPSGAACAWNVASGSTTP